MTKIVDTNEDDCDCIMDDNDDNKKDDNDKKDKVRDDEIIENYMNDRRL
jgi:hypothetical protein